MRVVFGFFLLVLLAACGNSPEIDQQFHQEEAGRLPPGYGLGSRDLDGKEVDLYTWVQAFPDKHFAMISETQRAIMKYELSEEQLSSLSVTKQALIRSAELENEDPQQGVQVWRDGRPVELYEALKATPEDELALFPKELKTAIREALTSDEMISLSPKQQEALSNY